MVVTLAPPDGEGLGEVDLDGVALGESETDTLGVVDGLADVPVDGEGEGEGLGEMLLLKDVLGEVLALGDWLYSTSPSSISA